MSQGRKEARELWRGAKLLTKDGKTLTVQNIGKRTGAFRVYNFSVAGTATYFVGKAGVLVHNCDLSDDVVRNALKDADLQPSQGAVSKPVIQRYVERLNAGETPPAINVDGTIIVNGHHRYIAERIAGKKFDRQPWPSSKPRKNWDDVKLDPTDWGNR